MTTTQTTAAIIATAPRAESLAKLPAVMQAELAPEPAIASPRHNPPRGVATSMSGCPTKRPTHVSHPAVDYMCEVLRCEGRTDLVHYAGASYRDTVAWAMCITWFGALSSAPEAELKAKALNLAAGMHSL